MVIRDIYDCQTQIDMKSIIVIPDLNLVNQLMNNSDEFVLSNLFVNLNTNEMTQTILSLLKQFYQINEEDLIQINQCLFWFHLIDLLF